jgi:hypothetical protein
MVQIFVPFLSVRGQQSPAVLEAELVLATVVIVDIAPIASEMANEISERIIARVPERFQRSGSCDDTARRPDARTFSKLKQT